MRKKILIIGSLILLTVATAVGLFFISKQKPSKDIVPDGVKMEIASGKKIIENDSQGYKLEMPSDWFFNGTNGSQSLEVSKTYKEFSPETRVKGEIYIAVENIGVYPLEEQIKEYKEKNNISVDGLISEPEKITLNGVSGYKEEYRLPEESETIKHYYFSSQDRLYILVSYISARFPNEKAKKESESLIKDINSDLENVVHSFAISL